MIFKRMAASVFGLGFILLLILSGCGLLGLGQSVNFKGRLKLKVGVMPFDDSAGLCGKQAGPRIAALLAKQLADYPGLLVLPMETVDSYLSKNKIPTPLTQNTATLIGRNMGLNAVILGHAAELSQVQKRSGWLHLFPFLGKKKEFVAAVMVAKVVDVENGTIITADTGKGEIQAGRSDQGAEFGPFVRGADQSTITASLEQAVASLAESIAGAFDNFRWKGFILSVSGGKAVLTGGADISIRAGDRFAVFTQGEKVTNVAGQVYKIPGPLKARLEAVKVRENTTEVRLLSGRVEVGDTAQPGE